MPLGSLQPGYGTGKYVEDEEREGEGAVVAVFGAARSSQGMDLSMITTMISIMLSSMMATRKRGGGMGSGRGRET